MHSRAKCVAQHDRFIYLQRKYTMYLLLHGKLLRNAISHLCGTESVSLCSASRGRQKTSVRVMEEVPVVSFCSHRPET